MTEAEKLQALRDASERYLEFPSNIDAAARLRVALRAYDPPKPDADVLAVRAILHAEQRAMPPHDSGWGDMSYEKGSYDHLPSFKAALAAYRSIRTLTSKEAE